MDYLAYQLGHEIVSLPPYHCKYITIEMIWAQVKGNVATRNNKFKIKDVRGLLEEALCRVKVENWKDCVKHSKWLQEEDFI